ncbi:hypothetical protein FNF31_06086 [Cafeteria roenbergensis]|uniref:HORMA domain-containing protein n=1 Tax=Cafeteria roenbergensis TaxID=33653 RepID=A0A5A8CEM5_CAFRO|nr:hypothetical protein FNF28_07272 [Cafeteria roenbergensis]KAA0155547.1 hypothetical protein FNF31_06086 [Cafeteria roenbergensis]
MAALAQATKPATEAKTATSTDITQASSTKMVRNLCRATVGELLWLRGVLPPADFDETAFGGVTTHLPRPGTPIADWLEDGVFVALEGGFLRAVVLSLWQLPESTPASSDTSDSAGPEGASLLESYIIRVTYSEDSQVHLSVEARSGSKFTRAGASRQAIALVRTLISLVNTLPQLPEADLLLSMRLYYYDDLVPHDDKWAPKHFSDARDIMPERFTGESPVKLLAGSAETSFHKMAMSVAFRRDYVTAAPAETSAAETPVPETSARGCGVAAADPSSAASRGDTGETASSRRPAAAAPEAAADPAAAREAKFQLWVDRVKAHVLATRTASLATLRQEFGNEIPPLMLSRVLETLVARNVLRRSGKRAGNAAQFRVMALDLPTAIDGKAAAAASSGSPKAKDDGDMPRMLFSLATLVAWEKRGDFLTQTALAKQIGLGRKERDVSRALIRKLVDRDLLASSTRGNQGREVHDSHKLRLAAQEASQWLQEKRMQGEASKRSLKLLLAPGPAAEGGSRARHSGASDAGAQRAAKRGRRGSAPSRQASDSGSDDEYESADGSDSDSHGARPRCRQRRSASESSGSDDCSPRRGASARADSSDDEAGTTDEGGDDDSNDDEDYSASSARSPAARGRKARRGRSAVAPSQASVGSVELRHRGGARARSVLGAAAARARQRALD